MKASPAKPLVEEVIAEISPSLPSGVHVHLGQFGRWLTLQKLTDGDDVVGGSVIHPKPDGNGHTIAVHLISGFGSWIPFLPPRVRARITAQDIVEQVLRTAYGDAQGQNAPNFDVHTRLVEDAVVVSYRPIGAYGDVRVELAPISLTRLK